MVRFMIGVALILTAAVSSAADYQYVKQEQFKTWLDGRKRMIVVDIQEPKEFAKQHFPGSIETGAYPVKTDSERQKLEIAVVKAAASPVDLVIVCPRGGGGAKGAFDYLKSRGVDEKRLYILEKGMQGWGYPEVTIRQK